MAFKRELLPDPVSYFEGQDLRLKGPGNWKTTRCVFHDGSDSMRVNTKTGGWCCMACGAKGGDVLSFHMRAYGLEFVSAAKAIGCWFDDGKPVKPQKPAPLPPRQALQVIGFEATLTAIAAGNVARGVALTDVDLARVMAACNRITRLVEAYA
jgi:CHC2 zinc finger